MPCLLSNDQPLRVQLSKGGVIHAGDHHHYTERRLWKGGSRLDEVIPAHTGIRIACSWREIPLDKEVSKKKTITCKNCMKRMGMIEGAVFPDRFVVRRKDTGEFFKNTRSRCSVWSEDISDAWFYKRRGDAEKKGKRVRWIDDKGTAHDCSYWVARQKGWRREEYYDPNIEVKKVKIELED